MASSLLSARLLPVLACVVLCLMDVGAAVGKEPASFSEVIERAVLMSGLSERPVDLPHSLATKDFPSEGGRVHYRLELFLADVPVEPLGVFVPKMSLSGAFALNGTLIGACGFAPLEQLRCLHQPQLFVPPPSIWRPGLNTLDFEIYANPRQMNGLSQVQVADAQALYLGSYGAQRIWKQNVLSGLTWFNLSFGFMALAVSLIMRNDRTYLWFGLCSIDNALTNLNILVHSPRVGMEFFSWFVFSSRLITIPLFLLMLLAIFERSGWRLQRVLLGFLVVMPLATWLSGNNRWVVLGLHLPMVLTLFVLAILMARWTWESRTPLHIAITSITYLLVVVVVLDTLRLAGQTAFVGVYWATYLSAGFVLVLGMTLMSRLAVSLMTERRSRIRLGLATQAANAAFWERDLLAERRGLTSRIGRLLGKHSAAGAQTPETWLTWNAPVHPDDQERVERAMRAAVQEHSPLSLEYRVLGSDEEIHWIETRADVLLDELGRPAQLAGISLDVTRRKQVEIELDRYRAELEQLVAERTAELRSSESLFRSFFNLPVVGTAITATDGRLVAANDRTCQLLGYPREELFQMTLAEVIDPEERSANSAFLARLVTTETGSFSAELRFRRKGGDRVPVLITGGLVQEPPGQDTLIHLQLLDLSARKQAEAALQRAHEELLVAEAERGKQEERQRLLQDMHDGFGSQLATARLRMNQGQLTPQEGAALLGECLADLHLVVDTLGTTDNSLGIALANYRYRCERRLSLEPADIHWALNLSDCPPLPERAILQTLRILQEGLTNALKHAHARHIRVEVTYRREESLTLSVTDDGVGLPQDIRFGRGMGGMETRARGIGARLEIIRLDPGTRLLLTIPVHPEALSTATHFSQNGHGRS